jgi:hypothetical protein
VIPKLDVAGSNPVSRSIKSTTCREFKKSDPHQNPHQYVVRPASLRLISKLGA